MSRTHQLRSVACLLTALCVLAPLRARAGEPGSTPVSAEDADLLRAISDPPREPSPAMVRRSVELYNEGTAHARAGRLKAAYRAFRDAYEQDGSAESLANAAVIEAALGRPRSAAEHLAHAIGRLPESRAAEKDSLRKRLDEVAKEIGTVEIAAPALSRVELDGKWVGTGPFTRTFYVEHGSHTVTVSTSGAEVTRIVQIAMGGKKTVVVTEAQLRQEAQLRADIAASAAAPPATTQAPSSNVPWILGGAIVGLAGAGGLGLGVYLRGHDERVKIEAQTRALGGSCGHSPTPGFVDDCRARDQEATNETIGMVMAIAGLGGAAALGTGVLIAMLSDSLPGASASHPARTERPRVAIGFGPTGVVLHGSF